MFKHKIGITTILLIVLYVSFSGVVSATDHSNAQDWMGANGSWTPIDANVWGGVILWKVPFTWNIWFVTAHFWKRHEGDKCNYNCKLIIIDRKTGETRSDARWIQSDEETVTFNVDAGDNWDRDDLKCKLEYQKGD